MQQFRDRQGGEWLIDLSIGCVDRIKAESENRFNLWNPRSPIDRRTLSEVLTDDFPVFWELLWHVVRPQAQFREIDAEKFGDIMAADCLIAAQTAFLQEWADFFRGLRKPDQALALEKTAAYRTKMVELIEARLADRQFSELDGRVESKINATLDESLTSLRGSLDAILGDSPGGK